MQCLMCNMLQKIDKQNTIPKSLHLLNDEMNHKFHNISYFLVLTFGLTLGSKRSLSLCTIPGKSTLTRPVAEISMILFYSCSSM